MLRPRSLTHSQNPLPQDLREFQVRLLARRIEFFEIVFRFPVSLFGRFAVPFDSLHIVSNCAASIAVEMAKLELSFGFTLLSSFAQP